MLNFNIKRVKIIVTCPPENAEEIKSALGDCGAGVIGNYTHCSICSECTGTFKGTDESSPYIGTKNKLETVKEIKIEVQCETEKVKSVLQKLRKVHPYEEPAIDIIPLVDKGEFD